MIRFCCSKGYIIIVAKLVILLSVSNQIIGKKVSKQQTGNFYFHDVNNAEIFYDTRVLPEGDEISAYLLYNETVKVLFLVEDDSPVSLTITPCASAVESMVTHKSISIPEPRDYDDGDPFEDQLEIAKPKPTTSTGTLLDSYVGSSTYTFYRKSNSSGIYTVFIKPTQSDTYVKFFLRLKNFHHFYPTLPSDNTIRQDKVRRKSFSFSWNPSQDETPFDNIITYCISVSIKRSYDNYCSLMSHMQGDKVPEAPQNGGFLFPWESEVKKVFRKKAKPVKPVNPREVHYTCVGRETKYIYSQARPGRTYYVNVYAVNKDTKRSSSYKKIKVTTKKRKRERIRKLRDGKLQELTFKKSVLRHDFKYDLKNASDLFLAVHSCTGKVTLRVTRGQSRGQQILKKKVKNSHIVELKKLEADTYFINLSVRRKNIPKVVRLVVSRKQTKLRYPTLPKQSKVVLVENSTTSNSLTIGWQGTNSRQKFCIYKKEILLSARRKRRRSYDHCSVAPIKDSKKVKCIRFRHEKRNMVLNHSIKNLKPRTKYQFDVVIQLGKGYSLLYKSLIAETKP